MYAGVTEIFINFRHTYIFTYRPRPESISRLEPCEYPHKPLKETKHNMLNIFAATALFYATVIEIHVKFLVVPAQEQNLA